MLSTLSDIFVCYFGSISCVHIINTLRTDVSTKLMHLWTDVEATNSLRRVGATQAIKLLCMRCQVQNNYK